MPSRNTSQITSSSSHKSSLTPQPPNCVQEFLNVASNRMSLRELPHINASLRKRAQNAIRNVEQNNDLLEFIGDRAVNLVMAIMVEEVKISYAHHKTVRRIVCNNDTFGRLSFYMHLHDKAEIDTQDQLAIEQWMPQSPDHPPKVLADLFEAYAGAVYIQSGWNKLESWLRKLFSPIIRSVTGHYWVTSSPTQIFGQPTHAITSRVTVPETRSRGKLLDYVEFKRDSLRIQGLHAIDTLPESTKFRFDAEGRLREPDIGRVEVAIHLLNMWICQVVIKLWPEYHAATARAAHMLSAITGLVVNERVMAYLASLLPLDELCFRERGEALTTISPTHSQRAIVLKATIGWFHRKEPSDAMAWGERWVRAIVVRAHDILVDLQRFRPLIPRHIYTRESTDAESGDSLASLVSGIQSLTIKHDTQAEKAKPAQSNHKKSHTLPRPFSKTEGSLSSAPSHLRVSNGETESGPKKIRIVLASPKTWVKDPVDDISKELTSLALHTSGDDNCSETPHRNDSPPQRLEEKQSPAAKGLQAMGPNIQAVNSKEAASESNSGAKDGYSESPASLPLSGASAQIESLQKAESPDEPPEITTNYKPPYKEPAHVSSIEAKVESPTMFIPRPLRSKGNPMAQTPNLSLSAKK